MTTRLLTASLVAVVCGGATLQADEPVLLRHKFEKEKPAIYRTEMAMEQAQSFAGQKIETTLKQTDVTVRSLEKMEDDGSFRLKSENKRLQMKMKVGPLGEYTFDSASTEREKGSALGAALTPLYERLSGASLTVTVTPQGKVTEVEGFKELVADVLKDNPIAAQFAGGGGNSAGKASYQDAFDQFPEKPVKPGDTWEVPYEIEMPKVGKVEGKRIYKVEAFDKVGERDTIRYSVALDLSFDLNLEVNGARVTGKMTASNASGTGQFDPAKGQLVSKKSKYTISGMLSVEANGQTIPIQSDQTQTITVELLDKLPE